ncbi:MAG: peptidylprolyl isomerase [Bacteroidia bacterium]|nr:peptidylprolyl isomerase [Bacteroidia bacterium]
MHIAHIPTQKGTALVYFYTEEAPITVENFCNPVQKTFYNRLIFDRVIPDFIIQTGYPSGSSTAGLSYTTPCKKTDKNQYHDRALSMTSKGLNTGSSQFLIRHNRKNTTHLDRNHACFGKVVEGLEVINHTKQDDKILSVQIIQTT